MFNGEINARVIRQLCGLAEKLDEQELFEFSRKIRIYYALSCLTKQDKYLDLCLDTIRNAILVGAVAGLSYDPTAKWSRRKWWYACPCASTGAAAGAIRLHIAWSTAERC